MAQKNKVFLIDGNAFCYRAFYAIQRLSTSKGEPTNAVYGFITMLKKIVQEQKPTHLAVCFDLKGPTFRDEISETYKATRAPMPEDLVTQMPVIKEVLAAARVPIYEMEGFEADDLLGTLSRRFADKDTEVFIATGDKDVLQLVNAHIKVYSTNRDGLIYDADKVRERFEGLGPEKIVDLMALMGDPSDNISGVPGIGPKTAIQLIKEFGSLEAVLKKTDQIKSKSVQTKLKEHHALALQSRRLAEINCDVPVPVKLKDLALSEPDEGALQALYKRLEFRTLLKELSPASAVDRAPHHYEIVSDKSALKKFAEQLKKQKAFSFDTETTSEDPHRAALVGMSFSWASGEAYYVPVAGDHAGPGLPQREIFETLQPVLEDERVKKYGQNIKYDLNVLAWHGVTLRGIQFDTMVASYLINPAKLNHNLDDLSFEHLGIQKIPTKSLLGAGKDQRTMDQVPLAQVAEYAGEDADCVWQLVEKFRPRLGEHGLDRLFNEVEIPLIPVLAAMERAGVKVDTDMLKELSDVCTKELETLSKQIYEEAGEQFNINSTKQLSVILFEKLNMPKIKRTKTGYSTDTSVLEKLSDTHAMARLLLEYREKSKLQSTYFDALPEMINPKTGLIHTSFNQTVTATGRLSSTEPNLQNIPIRSELGRKIRKAFVPRGAKRSILSADYSQIELRILAHFTKDKTLLKAYREDQDIHTLTAASLYRVKAAEVTREMRQAAKTLNFSLIYGKTAFGLSKDLQISVGEADMFIKAYFEQYPRVLEFMESQKEKARKQGYLTTVLGRRAYFPEIQSSNANLRNFAERAAINAPIQGSAADLIKKAMIDIHAALEARRFKAVMTLQVHDELVFDVPQDELDDLKKLVAEKMEHALTLDVPIKADLHVGANWYKE